MLSFIVWGLPVIIFFILLIVVFALMARVYNTKPVPYSSTPSDIGIPFETIQFPTKKELNLHGWWIPYEGEEDKPILVLVHGWRRNAERMMPYIEALHPHYGLLVFDSRNHGKSDSDNFTSMPKFTEDILAALDYLDTRPECKHSIKGLIGLSMGGGGAIFASALDKRISKVATVGSFANAADLMKREYKKRHIPYFPMVYLLFIYVQFRIGLKFRDFAPENQIAKSDAEFLIIHGTDDATAPFNHAERLVTASRNGKAELWGISGAGHSDCHTYPGFWEKVRDFFS